MTDPRKLNKPEAGRMKPNYVKSPRICFTHGVGDVRILRPTAKLKHFRAFGKARRVLGVLRVQRRGVLRGGSPGAQRLSAFFRETSGGPQRRHDFEPV